MQPENYSLTRREAAELVGLSDAALRNLVTRDGLFADRERRRGVPMPWTIREVIHLAAVKTVMDLGLSAREAVAAFSGLTVYGSMKSRGVSELSKLNGRWRAHIVNPDEPYITVPLWPLFEQVIKGWKPEEEFDPEFIEYLAHMRSLKLDWEKYK